MDNFLKDGRRPQKKWKTTLKKLEDDPSQKKMEDNLKLKMEDNLKKEWKMTSNKNGRRPQQKNIYGRRP